MSKIIIVISGRKGSGKDTLANMIAAAKWNLKYGGNNVSMDVNKNGDLIRVLDGVPRILGDVVNLRTVVGDEDKIRSHDIRIITFATKLKQFCMEVLGLNYASCYGTNDEKEKPTHIQWDGLPRWVRVKYASGAYYDHRQPIFHKWWKWLDPRTGPMTGREVMQIFGTEVIREWYNDAWADATYRAAAACEQSIAIIPDCRFPNEVGRRKILSPDIKVCTIRLLRSTYEDNHHSEHALDGLDKMFDVVVSKDISLVGMFAWAAEFARHYLND